MNESSYREFDDALLDRLVDGELNAQEYRALLAEFEAKPDGWRRCAMAFLEAQAWGNELRAMRDEKPAASKPAASKPGDGKRSNRLPRRWNWTYGGLITLASAASFALAFVIVPALLRSPRNLPKDHEFAAATERLKPSIPENVRDRGQESRTNQPSIAEGDPPQEYHLVVHENGRPREIEMPVFAPDDPRASLLMNEEATMPLELMRRLQKLGYQVDRQRQWTPVNHDGKGTVLVPIEELHITPVSGRLYQ